MNMQGYIISLKQLIFLMKIYIFIQLFQYILKEWVHESFSAALYPKNAYLHYKIQDNTITNPLDIVNASK